MLIPVVSSSGHYARWERGRQKLRRRKKAARGRGIDGSPTHGGSMAQEAAKRFTTAKLIEYGPRSRFCSPEDLRRRSRVASVAGAAPALQRAFSAQAPR